jgi:hypothetical protein
MPKRTLNEFLATSALVSTPSIPPRKRATPEPEGHSPCTPARPPPTGRRPAGSRRKRGGEERGRKEERWRVRKTERKSWCCGWGGGRGSVPPTGG